MPEPLKSPPKRSEPAKEDPSSAAFAERRRHLRQPVGFPVRYRCIDPQDLAASQQEYLHGICRNISEGGMLIEVEGHMLRGQVLEIYASPRTTDATLYGMVETVRIVRAPHHYEIGVRFLSREQL